MEPHPSHTPSTLDALPLDELEAMVDGHPSKQDWGALLAED